MLYISQFIRKTKIGASELNQLRFILGQWPKHLYNVSNKIESRLTSFFKYGKMFYRRKNSRSSLTKQEDTTGIIMTDKDIQQEGESESVYANNVMLSPAEAATLNLQESLHYASIDFKNIKPESEEIRGVSSLTTDYAVISYSGKVRETKGSVRGDQPNSNVSALKSQKY